MASSRGLTLLIMAIMNTQLIPSTGEMETRYEAEKRLRRYLIKGYDVNTIPTKNEMPVEIIPVLTVDHISGVEQDFGTMTIFATFTFSWMDNRLSWNTSDFSGIRTLIRTKLDYDLGRMWFPVIELADVPSATKQQDLFMDSELEILIEHSGSIKATITTEITPSCYLSFGDFPNDLQNCSFTLMTPLYADVFRFAGDVDSARGILGKHVKKVHDMKIIQIESKSYFLMMGFQILEEALPSQAQWCRSFQRFNIKMKRVNYLVFAQLNVPLMCIIVAVFSHSVLPNKYGWIVLMMTMMIEILFALTMVSNLLDNYNGTPVIAKLALFIFLETALLAVWKFHAIVARTRLRRRIQHDAKTIGEPNPRDVTILKTIIYIDLFLIPFLAVQANVMIYMAYTN